MNKSSKQKDKTDLFFSDEDSLKLHILCSLDELDQKSIVSQDVSQCMNMNMNTCGVPQGHLREHFMKPQVMILQLCPSKGSSPTLWGISGHILLIFFQVGLHWLLWIWQMNPAGCASAGTKWGGRQGTAAGRATTGDQASLHQLRAHSPDTTPTPRPPPYTLHPLLTPKLNWELFNYLSIPCTHHGSISVNGFWT